MGLRYGAQKLIENLRRGLYNRRVQHYQIYVDGELMRYKGMVASNMACHNACEAIATTGFDYMMSLIECIQDLFPCRADGVIVYMDGQHRVKNKVVRVSSQPFDVDIIRNIFKGKCLMNGMEIVELLEGESELQMYLQRDRSNDLNIFITSDSDMIAITYGHEPISVKPYEELTFETEEINGRIADVNETYSNTSVNDSCLWVNCSYCTAAIGCDYNENRLRLKRRHFLVFIGMCGTDYTDSLLTESMIAAILKAPDKEIDVINGLVEIEKIVFGLVYIGIKYGGTLKHVNPKRGGSESLDVYISNLQQYSTYIETGVMMDSDMDVVNTPAVSRVIFSDLGYPGTSFKRSELVTWTQMHSLEDLL